MLTLPQSAAHDDGDVGVGNIEALIEYPRRHERSEVSAAKALQRVITLCEADVAGQRHDEMLARDGVCSFVVGSEDQDSGITMAIQQ